MDTQIQSDLISLKGKLATEIANDEKQVALISSRMEKNKALLHAINGSLGAIVAEATGYGKLAETIRAAIKAIPSIKFTADDVERQIRMDHPTAPLKKDGIRTTIWSLVKREELKQVRKGNNKMPAEYEKTGDFLSKIDLL